MSIPTKFFVEISETPTTATIVADGKAVPVPKVSDARLAEFLEPLVEPEPQVIMKVIGQSIAPGDEYTVSCFVDSEGRGRCAVPRKRPEGSSAARSRQNRSQSG